MKKILSFVSIGLTILCLHSCITLTAKKQSVTFTSYPSGAKVYRVFDGNYGVVDGINNYYIGTTPFTYKAKGAGDSFAFVKDGYNTEIVKTKRKGRWAAYILGNLCWMPYGYFVDINKIYKYEKNNYSVTLKEKPRSVVAQTSSSPSSVNVAAKVYEVSNAKMLIKPSYLPSTSRIELSNKKIFKKYNSAVFMIYGGDNYKVGQGSGFVINGSGLAISNYHNFNGMMVVGIKMYGRDKLYEIKKDDIIAYNQSEDYIIFKLPKSIMYDLGKSQFDYIPVAQSKLEIGDKVVAIGSPRGLENTLSSGEVSQFREMPYTIQINAPIDHGSSGGALINEYGEAVGITSAGRDDSGANLNFAIDLIRVLNKYKY